MARTVAVTGAAGNLGRLVVERLLASAEVERVIALDRRPVETTHAKLSSAACDVRDAGALAERLRGADAVVHLAFIVERGSRDEGLTEQVNLGGTRSVCEAVATAGVGQVVHASSVAAYGFRPENEGVELREDMPLFGDEGFYYPRHKAQAEKILLDFESTHPAVAVARLRPTLFLGPRTDPKRAALFRAPFFGYTGRPDIPVQITHEDDVADAFVLALEQQARGAFNVAAAEPLTMDRWGAAMGKPCVRVPRAALAAYGLAYRMGLGDIDPAWAVEPGGAWIVASSEKIRRELGWKPRFDSAGAVLRSLAGRPTAAASRPTKLLFGGLVRTSRWFGGMPLSEREKAELKGMNGSLNLVFTGERPSEWHVSFRDSSIRFGAGLDPRASATATLAERVFYDMLAGKLSYTRAQMTGKVRFRGEGHLALVLGVLVEQMRQAERAKGVRGFPRRAFMRWIVKQSGSSKGEGAAR